MKYILVRENVITLKMIAHIYHKYKIFMNFIWNLKLRFEYNEFWGYLSSFFNYLGRISTKDLALKRLLYRKVPDLWGLHILQGCLIKLSELVQRCTCFKGLIFLELRIMMNGKKTVKSWYENDKKRRPSVKTSNNNNNNKNNNRRFECTTLLQCT